MKVRNIVISITSLALILALIPLVSVGATETAPAEAPSLDLEALLTEVLVTPMSATTSPGVAESLNMGPKPVGLCANNGCATTCRDDDDCGPDGNCIYTACF